MALSADVQDLTVVGNHANDTHTMFADIGTGFIYFTTVDQQNVMQHDISMTFEEWELFKQIIDMGIAKERCNWQK